jgi:hypothetical protein
MTFKYPYKSGAETTPEAANGTFSNISPNIPTMAIRPAPDNVDDPKLLDRIPTIVLMPDAAS